MKRRGIAAGLALLTSCIGAAAFAELPAGFDARVEEIRKSVGVPGMSIAVVEDGKVALARGYGLRRMAAAEPADADTIFPIGSVSKAFTSAALAILVDRGQINWDDPVVEHLPWFQMYDAWVTREMTIRDLLVHRSGLGLGAGDLLFVPRSSLGRKEIAERLRHIKPATSFRSAYAYDNLLYIVAGVLIEEVSGKSWENFVRDEILRPAGMRTATSDSGERRKTSNRAWPHIRINGPMHGMGDQSELDDSGKAEFDPALSGAAAPAGGITASANDMGRWMALQLAHGALPEGEKRVFSEAASREMWSPVVPLPIGQAPEPVAASTPQFSSYALGWQERDYKGHRIVMHTGAVFGSQAILMLVPDRNVGFSVAINCEDGEAALGVAWELLDHYLGQPRYDWGKAWQDFVKLRDQAMVAELTKETSAPAKAGPSLPLASFAGDFTDVWYGPIAIAAKDGGLTVDFRQTPGMTGKLSHWQYDTFRVDFRDPLIEPAYMTFGLGADGKVERISMRPVSPMADFSFDYKDLDFRPAAAK